jgi:hypothetical protein
VNFRLAESVFLFESFVNNPVQLIKTFLFHPLLFSDFSINS